MAVSRSAVSGEGSATYEATVETRQRIETQERERVADGVGIEVRMTLHCTSDIVHERSGVGQGWLDARVSLLHPGHPSIIDHSVSHGMVWSSQGLVETLPARLMRRLELLGA